MNKENRNKNTDISARIAEILDYINESKNSFALKLGYERAQTVYDIINGKSAPSYDFFKKFQLSEYSDIINILVDNVYKFINCFNFIHKLWI